MTWYQQRGFSGIFGSGSIPVSARAVAGVVKGPVWSSRPPRGVSRVVVRGRMNQPPGNGKQVAGGVVKTHRDAERCVIAGSTDLQAVT